MRPQIVVSQLSNARVPHTLFLAYLAVCLKSSAENAKGMRSTPERGQMALRASVARSTARVTEFSTKHDYGRNSQDIDEQDKVIECVCALIQAK